MVSWRSLVKKIPAKIQISNKIFYEICWADELGSNAYDYHGETRFDTKQIFIKKGMSPKLTMITYFHECLHAASHEYELNLTETQILAMEKTFYYLLKKDNFLKEKKNK